MEKSELKKTSLTSAYFTLTALFLFALFIRFLPFNSVFHGGKVYFYDGDCYVHIRKILLHLRNFPSFVTFDPFEGFPEGTGAIWPPLLDFLMAVASLIIGFGDPTTREVEVTAALIPPLLGGGAVVAAYFFAKGFFSKKTALLSALLLALMPPHVIATVVGRPDNEMTEPLMTTLLFLCFLRMIKGDERLVTRTIQTALAALLTLFFWRGGTLWIMLMVAASLLDMTALYLRGEEGGKGWRACGGLFLLLAFSLSLFCYFDLFGNQSGFRFNIISWFHVILFAGSGAVIVLYGFFLRLLMDKGCGARHLFMALFVLAVAGVAAMFFFSNHLGGNIAEALAILGFGETDPWIDSIAEYGSLRNEGLAGFRQLPGRYGWTIFALPFFFIFLIIKEAREGLDRGRLFFLLLMASAALLSLLRQRFDHIFSLFVAITGGRLITLFYEQLKSVLQKEGFAALLCTLFLALFLIYPLARFFPVFASSHPGFNIEGPVEDAMLWLKENTPTPGDPYEVSASPPYAIMARWDYAGWIEYPAERPVVATLYGFETFGLKESAAFHLAESEAEARGILDRVGARYLLITKTIGALHTFAGILGRDGEGYTRLVDLPGGKGQIYQPGPKYYGLVATRLLMADGRDMKVGPVRFGGLDHFRLVYESKERMNLVGFPEEVKLIKIFEYLPGAKLIVKAEPGEEVTLSGRVRTNRGRTFEILKRGTANNDGEVLFILPYSTEETLSGWQVRAGEGRHSRLDVSEEAVKDGKEIRLELF